MGVGCRVQAAGLGTGCQVVFGCSGYAFGIQLLLPFPIPVLGITLDAAKLPLSHFPEQAATSG